MEERTYIAIDLKSFYASVECVDRGLDPLDTNLVVADMTRTEKTICEVTQRLTEVNRERAAASRSRRLTGKSVYLHELKEHPDWEVNYIAAPPRMGHYLEVSKKVYEVYLKYIAPEDIHVYSVDEVFMDVTQYLKLYKLSAHSLAMKMIRDVLSVTGITATAGIGANLYLAKVAMDIVAKKMPADKDGVRIAELDEASYREQLWDYRPITKFWRVGRGTAARLALYGIDTMGKLARASIEKEELLYSLFGVNAELLIDHAWGWEPCTMDLVKAYRPETKSFSRGQVLSEPYSWEKARIVMLEMAEAASLHLVARHLATDQVVITVSYDAASLSDPSVKAKFKGPVGKDYYGRPVPKHAQGTANLGRPTSSTKLITEAVANLYDSITDRRLLVRRLNISTNRVVDEAEAAKPAPLQLDLFTDYESAEKERRETLEKERRLQEAQLAIKQRYGKNAILKGIDFEEGATTRERNAQIGGHKA